MLPGLDALPLVKDFLRQLRRVNAIEAQDALGLAFGVRNVTTSQVLTASDAGKQIVFLNAAGSADLTLPESSSVQPGSRISVVHSSSTSMVLNVLPADGESVFQGNDTTSISMRSGDSAELVSTAGGWNLSGGTAVLRLSRGAPLLGGLTQLYGDQGLFRLVNTTHTNATARPILAIVTLNAGATLPVTLLIDGNTIANTAVLTGQPLILVFVIRPGGTFRINTTATLARWWELS